MEKYRQLISSYESINNNKRTYMQHAGSLIFVEVCFLEEGRACTQNAAAAFVSEYNSIIIHPGFCLLRCCKQRFNN